LQHLKIREMPDVEIDVLITALAGWADAGEAATAAMRCMLKQFEAKKFAELDPEEFYDFSQVRPYTSLTKEGVRRVRWPANELLYTRTGRSGRGLMFFLGVEPSLKWRTYAETIIDLAQQCGVAQVVHIGALLDAVPHTREVLLTGSSNNLELSHKLESHDIRPSRYQGPTGITSAVLEACSGRDLSFTTIWGHAPHYLHAAPNYVVSHALIKALSSLFNIEVDSRQLEEAAATYQQEVSPAVDEDSQLCAYVQKLEERYDHAQIPVGEMPHPEELVRDVEDFLKRHRRSPGGAD